MIVDWIDNYRHCDSTGVYFDTPSIQRLVVRGADRAKFLQNMCTNDVANLAPGQACETLFTNVKGHVLAHTVAECLPDEIALYLLGSEPAELAMHLERYIIREEVTLDIDDAAWGLVVAPPEKMGARARTNLLIQPTFFANSSAGFIEGVDDVWNALRIEAGLPLAGVDYGEGTLPQELSRDARAISFTKGCYLGQETVARIDAVGHVNKKLVGVKFTIASPPSIDAELQKDEKPVGAITSLTYSPVLDAWLGLALVRRGSNEPGTKLDCGGEEAEVVALPVAS